MDKLISVLVTIIGIVLLLPLITLDIGVAGSWIIAIAVLIIGIKELIKK
tara:strand:- start:928 stop:1074 length:147 start_codon:yes stop_codon:yes gene_type:complete